MKPILKKKSWFVGAGISAKVAALADQGPGMEDSLRKENLFSQCYSHRWVYWAIAQCESDFLSFARSDPKAAEILGSGLRVTVDSDPPLICSGVTSQKLLKIFLDHLVLRLEIPGEKRHKHKKWGSPRHSFLYSPLRGDWQPSAGDTPEDLEEIYQDIK